MRSDSILKGEETESSVSHTGADTMIGEAAAAIQEASGKDVSATPARTR